MTSVIDSFDFQSFITKCQLTYQTQDVLLQNEYNTLSALLGMRSDDIDDLKDKLSKGQRSALRRGVSCLVLEHAESRRTATQNNQVQKGSTAQKSHEEEIQQLVLKLQRIEKNIQQLALKLQRIEERQESARLKHQMACKKYRENIKKRKQQEKEREHLVVGFQQQQHNTIAMQVDPFSPTMQFQQTMPSCSTGFSLYPGGIDNDRLSSPFLNNVDNAQPLPQIIFSDHDAGTHHQLPPALIIQDEFGFQTFHS